MPDPSANPYLALAVQLAAGLDGMRRKQAPPETIDKNIWTLSVRERRRYRIQELPRDLGEAITLLKRSSVRPGGAGRARVPVLHRGEGSGVAGLQSRRSMSGRSSGT
jgi:glutamine synthetase